MMSHSECELDHLGGPVSEFLKRNQRSEPRRQGYYDDVADSDYVPAVLRPSRKTFQPDVTLEEELETLATTNNCPDVLVPNWLAWIVLGGMVIAVLAITGWIIRPQSKTFLGLTTLAVFAVTVSLFYGEYYLNERSN